MAGESQATHDREFAARIKKEYAKPLLRAGYKLVRTKIARIDGDVYLQLFLRIVRTGAKQYTNTKLGVDPQWLSDRSVFSMLQNTLGALEHSERRAKKAKPT